MSTHEATDKLIISGSGPQPVTIGRAPVPLSSSFCC